MDITLFSPYTGTIHPITEAPDPVFADHFNDVALSKGIGILFRIKTFGIIDHFITHV